MGAAQSLDGRCARAHCQLSLPQLFKAESPVGGSRVLRLEVRIQPVQSLQHLVLQRCVHSARIGLRRPHAWRRHCRPTRSCHSHHRPWFEHAAVVDEHLKRKARATGRDAHAPITLPGPAQARSLMRWYEPMHRKHSSHHFFSFTHHCIFCNNSVQQLYMGRHDLYVEWDFDAYLYKCCRM